MNRKLRTWILSIPQPISLIRKELKEHIKADIHLKVRQKQNYDKCHWAKEHPSFEKGQPAWLMTPNSPS